MPSKDIQSDTFTDVSETERAWLERCAPVFCQPEHDIKHGHPLLKVFYSFCEDAKNDEPLCELIVVYEGEASYRRMHPLRMNHFATFFYMTFNRIVFGRTADINYLTITGVDLTAEGDRRPWRSIRTRDHCGSQTWSQGNKGNLFHWLSLFYHYKVDLPYHHWEKDSASSDRPTVYVNTANHMMGEKNQNPDLPFFLWTDYTMERGGSTEAERYARVHVPPKPVLWAPFRTRSQGYVFRYKKDHTEVALGTSRKNGSMELRIGNFVGR